MLDVDFREEVKWSGLRGATLDSLVFSYDRFLYLP